MSALVELYLRDYYELAELGSVNNDLLSKIDIDIAMEALKDFYSPSQWKVVQLFCMGYTSREIAEILQWGFRAIQKAQLSICRAIEHHLGWEYSDAKIHRMVARKLNIVKLLPEQKKFVQLKLDNYSNYMFTQYTIFNFAFDPYGRVVFRR